MPPMLESHAALWESTGRPEMSVFQTLSEGYIAQLGAPGTGVPAAAGPAATSVSPAPVTAATVTAAAILDAHPLPMVVICIERSARLCIQVGPSERRVRGGRHELTVIIDHRVTGQADLATASIRACGRTDDRRRALRRADLIGIVPAGPPVDLV